MKYAIEVLTDKGGTGKSLTALMLVELARRHGVRGRITVVEADHERKLSKFLESRGDKVDVTLSASAGLEEASKDRTALESHFDPIYEARVSGHTITDTGANVASALAEWERLSDVPDAMVDAGVRKTFVVPVTPDGVAIEAGYKTIRTAVELYGDAADYVLLLNDINGDGFDAYRRGQAFKELAKLEAAVGLKIIELPFSSSRLVQDYGNLAYLSPMDVYEQADMIAEKLGLSKPKANRELKKLTEWIAAATAVLEPIIAPIVEGCRKAEGGEG